MEQVLEFFERCKFPTEGIRAGQVDGGSLLELYQDADAQSLFMAPAPDGLGFNKLMFKGRFKSDTGLHLCANILAKSLLNKPTVYLKDFIE